MKIVAWLAEGTWPAGVDAAARCASADAHLVLLHVIDPALAASVHGAYTGLIGRGRRGVDPGAAVSAAAEAAEASLLEAAAARLGRPAQQVTRRGRLEREVTAVAAEADLLVVVRDGDLSRLGPRSLAPATRFVVDHAACPVLLVWPQSPPGLASIPPPPDR